MKRNSALAFTFALIMLTGFNGALPSATPSLAAAPSVATAYLGSWQTTWKNPDGSTASAPLTVKADSENANTLDGVVEMKGPNAVLHGSLSTDSKTWSGDWWNAKGEKGTFTFVLKGNKQFEGSYTLSGTSGSFSWNGTK
jgi:hypothetical protein